MSQTKPSCIICGSSTEPIANPFCEMQARLLCAEAKVNQYLCIHCNHGWLQHDVPLNLLYNSNVALPTEYVGGDVRFRFLESNVDLSSITGAVVEFGGGPGELAEQARRATGKQRATVMDFVDRVAADTLDFMPLDFNSDAAKIPLLLNETREQKNLFLLSHVVEHLYDPLVLLHELSKFSNSLLYIEVPNFGSFHDVSTLKFSLNCLEHLHYFTAGSLTKLLEKAGYEILAFETQSAPRMPALRALCAPANAGQNALIAYQLYFSEIADRLAKKIIDAGQNMEIWVWGLSAFMAQALNDLGQQRERVAGIFDTRFPHEEFMGIRVQREPRFNSEPNAGMRTLIVCGSTYSAVQKAIGAKAAQVLPDAEFFAVSA